MAQDLANLLDAELDKGNIKFNQPSNGPVQMFKSPHLSHINGQPNNFANMLDAENSAGVPKNQNFGNVVDNTNTVTKPPSGNSNVSKGGGLFGKITNAISGARNWFGKLSGKGKLGVIGGGLLTLLGLSSLGGGGEKEASQTSLENIDPALLQQLVLQNQQPNIGGLPQFSGGANYTSPYGGPVNNTGYPVNYSSVYPGMSMGF